MQYADGGNLWDVLESSEYGRLSQSDLDWWIPQMVSGIEWCHTQGFVHRYETSNQWLNIKSLNARDCRDIKPNNFVLTPASNLLLIDFGSAAPLLPASRSGIQLVPKEYCLVPCGTCDYISPEILAAHEEALVALEIGDDVEIKSGRGGYGRETDWWSMGAMIYELLYGVAPFFASDVKTTYLRIIDHQASVLLIETCIRVLMCLKTSLQFDPAVQVTGEYIDLLRRYGFHDCR